MIQKWNYPPTKPVREGYIRHQYFLIFDKKSYNAYNYQEKAFMINIAFNGYTEFAEIFHQIDEQVLGIRAWVDLKDADEKK